MRKLLIKNAKHLINNELKSVDILVENGRISKLTENLEGILGEYKILDAEELLILPGGIDPHVHMHLPTPAGFSSDDFYTGSKAALHGGTTTLVDFVTPKRGQSIVDALALRKEKAKSSLVDYKFHVSPVEWTNTTEKEIIHCIRKEGVISFKIYMAYKDAIGLDDEDILKVMKVVGKEGGIVTVHAEFGDDIEALRNQFASEGKVAPEFHPKSRPANLEALAVKRAIEMAGESSCPLYIVHVSAKESVDYIRKAQSQGQKVYAETCMHYLLLDDSKYLGNFTEASPYVLSPPLRKEEDQDALWNAIADGAIQTIGTDHCPFNLNEKRLGEYDFRKIPNGAGSVEHRLSLLYTYGVLQKRISLEQFIQLASENAAKIFGFHNKGTIEIGKEADLLIWNSEINNVISTDTHQMNCDNNIFEGFKTRGAPQLIIKGGEIVYEKKTGLKQNILLGNFIK